MGVGRCREGSSGKGGHLTPDELYDSNNLEVAGSNPEPRTRRVERQSGDKSSGRGPSPGDTQELADLKQGTHDLGPTIYEVATDCLASTTR